MGCGCAAPECSEEEGSQHQAWPSFGKLDCIQNISSHFPWNSETLEPADTSFYIVLVKDSRAPLLPFWRGENAAFLFFFVYFVCRAGSQQRSGKTLLQLNWKRFIHFQVGEFSTSTLVPGCLAESCQPHLPLIFLASSNEVSDLDTTECVEVNLPDPRTSLLATNIR